MAKVTWLGEDHLHNTVTSEGVTVEGAGPSFTTWKNRRFDKGVPVDVSDPEVIAKAKRNPFFKVEGAPGRPPKVKDDGDHKDAE